MPKLNFHPEHLMTQQRPILPGSSIMPVSVIITVIVAITMAIFTSIDVITTAKGHIIPSGKVKTLRAARSGVVSKLAVHDGQRIKQGEILIQMDDRSLRAQLREIEAELQSVQSQLILYSAVNRFEFEDFKQLNLVEIHRKIPEDESVQPLQRAWIIQRLSTIKDQLDNMERERVELLAEMRYAKTQALQAKEIEPLIQASHSAREALLAKNYVSKAEITKSSIELQKARFASIEYRQRKELLDVRMVSLNAKIPTVFRRFKLEFAEQQQALDLQEKKLQAQHRGIVAQLDSSRLLNPISGIVEKLSVAATGIYVNAGDALLTIVPTSQSPIAKVRIPSGEVGFLRADQKVRIKVDAFPYTRYGSLPGKLVYLSSDSIQSEDGSKSFYLAHINLSQKAFNTYDGLQTVQIGMSVQVEIITDQRSLIDFFIAPIKETLLSALRER